MGDRDAKGTDEGDGGQRKRARRSGWDVQAPTGVIQPVVVAAEVVQPNGVAIAQQLALQRAQQQAAALMNPFNLNLQNKAGCRIYVGSIHYDLREPDLVALFSSFGTITKSEMTIDPATGRTKGFCFLEFAEPAQAEAAMAMDQFELAGRKIKVGRPFHGQGAVAPPVQQLGTNPLLAALQMPIATPLAANLSAQQAIAKLNAALASGTGVQDILNCVLIKNVTLRVTLAELRPIFEAFGTVKRIAFVEASRVPDLIPETQCAVVEFETAVAAQSTTDGLNNFPLGGCNLSLSVIGLTKANKLLEVDTSSFKRVVLEDMVTYEDTLDPDLKDEISEEANNYGTLENIDITVDDKRNVTITLLYAAPEHASKALKAMNGRAFGGKKIKAVLAP